jgi:osmotically-inducible protein OsmY
MRWINKAGVTGISFVLIVVTLACGGPDDATLATQVKSKLVAEAGAAAAAILVDVKDKVVTLTGTVGTDADKSNAERIAKSVKGVKSVSNNLTVRPAIINAPPPQVSPDAVLKNAVTAALTKYGVSGVNVEVANGEVTLTGNVPRAKLQDVLKAANESNPKKVNNRLTIK